MAWTRTRLEVPAIAGDPPVLLATPPRTADGLHDLAERLRPPTSWSVQWIPFQKEGNNEGTAAG